MHSRLAVTRLSCCAIHSTRHPVSRRRPSLDNVTRTTNVLAEMAEDIPGDPDEEVQHTNWEPSTNDGTSRGAMAGIEAYHKLGEEERKTLEVLLRRVHFEINEGGPRSLYSMLRAFKDMTNEQIQACITLYYKAQTEVTAAKKESFPPPSNLVDETPPPTNFGSRGEKEPAWDKWTPWGKNAASQASQRCKEFNEEIYKAWERWGDTTWGWAEECDARKAKRHGKELVSCGGAKSELADQQRDMMLDELREHVRTHEPVFLSTIGVKLSHSFREYLKRQNVGLKHFLQCHNAEFRIEGHKGQETVCWQAAADNTPYVNSALPYWRTKTDPLYKETGSKVYIGNLPGNFTEEEVTSLVSKYGHIEDVHVMRSNAKTGLSSAMVVYSDRRESDRCIAGMAYYELRKGGGNLIVKYADDQRLKGKGKGKNKNEKGNGKSF